MSEPNFPVQVDTIREWLLEGQRRGATHCLVIYDSWDYEDYPLYVMPSEDVREVARSYAETNSTVERLMEVYDLRLDIEEQLKEDRAFHY